jgi:hypothetical protein
VNGDIDVVAKEGNGTVSVSGIVSVEKYVELLPWENTLIEINWKSHFTSIGTIKVSESTKW